MLMRSPNSTSLKRPGPRPGFTLPGLVLALASVCVLAAVTVPLYRQAKNTATLRATISDMEMWGRAIERYTLDHGAPPTNPRGRLTYKKPIVRELLPYLEKVRITDLWGFSFWIWTGPGTAKYGIKTSGRGDFIIASLGKKERPDGWAFDPGRPQAGLYEMRAPEDFEKDIVLWNGRFVRGPIQP